MNEKQGEVSLTFIRAKDGGLEVIKRIMSVLGILYSTGFIILVNDESCLELLFNNFPVDKFQQFAVMCMMSVDVRKIKIVHYEEGESSG